MAKNYVGTVTINGTSYNVEGPLTPKGRLVTGTLVFTSDQSIYIPLKLTRASSGVSTASSIFFKGPAAAIIEILPINSADTSASDDLRTISITDTDIIRNGIAGLLSLSVSVEQAEISTESFAVEDAIPDRAPERKQITRVRVNEVGNIFDHFGSLLSIPRLPSEANRDYVERIRLSIAKKSNATYNGLINGAIRELGLNTGPSLKVSIRDDYAGDKSKLRFCIEEGWARIYSEWINLDDQHTGLRPVLEQETELNITVGKLADWINGSAYYKATIVGDDLQQARFIRVYDSRKLITEELLPQDKMRLSQKNVVQGSLQISRSSELSRPVAEASDVNLAGEYAVDYSNGFITAYTQPTSPVLVSYIVSELEFYLEASEIRIIDLTSRGAQRVLFNQIETDLYNDVESKTINGLPTNEMYDIIRKVLTAGSYSQYWGE